MDLTPGGVATLPGTGFAAACIRHLHLCILSGEISVNYAFKGCGLNEYFVLFACPAAESSCPGRVHQRRRRANSPDLRDRRDPMNETDRLCRENAELRTRIAQLSAASLRIGSSLDLDTVLGEIAENARALTGARYAAIATIDEAGAPQDFVTSGFTEDEHRAMAEWADGPRLFEHFRDLDGPLRIADVPGHVRALGFSPDRLPWGTFQGTPMRHRGEHVGNFYLVEKEGGAAFTDDDEEILVLFGAQAAAAIANARIHRAEQQARADLEALVETSPVGVVVLDASTGRAVSFNREARRIVGSLLVPDCPPEELLSILTLRRADGREIALTEIPIAEALGSSETVRAEEIVLSTPDGKSVTTLVNATPILSRDGAVGSVVVTLQDLAPLEELDRMRSEFLGMVSHELRTPLAAIKGSTAAVLSGVRNFAPAETRAFFRVVDEQADRMIGLVADLLDAGCINAGTLSIAPEPTEVAALVESARTAFLSGGGQHAVQVDLPTDLPRVMADRERIAQVLGNLLDNAVRQAPESAPIRIAAGRDGVHVAVSVADQGRGIAQERLPHLFRKHGRTGASEPDAGGSGLGLSICRGLVEAHGGRIRAESAGPGQGACFTFTLPVADEPGAFRTDLDRPALRSEAECILVVDDDPQTLRFVRDTLAGAGYSPVVTGEHHEIGRIVRNEQPALVLLDLVLPGVDGIELMKIRPELSRQPVIFISGYGRDETVARALEAGAADYIVKPFSPTELVARVRAALRRRADPEPFVLGDLAIDYDQRLVTVAGRAVELTQTEYELLRALSLEAGKVVPYETLLYQVWSERRYASWKVVRAFVKQLRAKLGDDAADPTWIFNVRGVGYRMPRPGEMQA